MNSKNEDCHFGEVRIVRLVGAKMTFSDFKHLFASQPDGVVLLEGRRLISPEDYERATKLARHHATQFPRLRFRSGNAEGSDQAFFEGVAQVDANRLQVVAPYATHRKGVRYTDELYDSPASMSKVQEDEVAYKTISATPKNRGLIEKRNTKGRLAAKAAYREAEARVPGAWPQCAGRCRVCCRRIRPLDRDALSSRIQG